MVGVVLLVQIMIVTLITLKSADQVTIYDNNEHGCNNENSSVSVTFQNVFPECDANPAAQVIR